MKRYKQILMTLALLLTAIMGAWAEEKMVTINSSTMSSGAVTATGFYTIENFLFVSNKTATITTSEGVITKLVIKKYDGSFGDAFTEDNVGVAPGTINYGSDEITVTDINAESVTLSRKGNYNWSTSSVDVYYGAPATGPEVAWDKAKKTGTFTMPGGNVTLEPEYFPQATMVAGAVTAVAGVKATTDDPLVTLDKSKLIGASGMMYYVGTTDTKPAYNAEGWTSEVPTAADITIAKTVYVWYYPVGADSDNPAKTYSDGEMNINALQVAVADPPTYAVTFAEGVNPEPPAEPEWTASPNADVKKGETVTVTYSGPRKVMGVKAEKKAAPKALAEATAEDYGKVVCAAGHLHDAKTAVPTGCTAVGILGKVTETGHGLILALQDAAQQNWNTINGWTSVTTYAGTTLKQLPAGALGSLTSYTTLGSTTVSNWCVAQKSDYDAIFQNLGSTQHDQDGYTYDGNVNAYITTGIGGTAISDKYWSATWDSGNWAYDFESEYWNIVSVTNSLNVRPVLGF